LENRVEEVFHDVVDLSAEARDNYFREHQVSGSTRKLVEALIAFDTESSVALERHVGKAAEQVIDRVDLKETVCGHFRLGELLGRGGMGSVYLGERIDGELQQKVAIKLLRPGADDPHLRRRFLAERQILAGLSHPQIARMLDAGHRDDGQPYLVMEYIKGDPIDVYTARMSVRQRLRLFLKVCSAVSHLHRNLVVHRDLKPSNILVTAEGEPVLLDFGLAKMLDLTSDVTMTSMRMLTPDFASPEQVAGGAVTTATDIYSLGAVLYKLLTDEGPHKFEGDSPGAIALAISTGKIIPPSRLAPVIKNDLEMIVMKALRREPQERYATIDQFAEDLENFLESRPIRARRGDAWYRTRKFVRRHWPPVAAAALSVAGLVTGLAFANHERSIVQRRFSDVRQLSNKLFDIDRGVQDLPGNTKVRQMIVDTSLEYLRRLSADAARDPDLALEVGYAYLRLARVQGVPVGTNLGQVDAAETSLREGDRLIQSVLRAEPSNRTAMLRAAQIAHDHATLARTTSRDEEALHWAEKSAVWLDRFGAQPSDEPEWNAILATYLNVADQHMYGRKFDDALRLCRRALEVAKIIKHDNYYVGTFHWVSAEVYRRRGQLDDALTEISESVRLLEPGPEEKAMPRLLNFALARTKQGMILAEDHAVNMDRPEEGVAVLERVISLLDPMVHQDPKDQSTRSRLAMAANALGDILRHSNPRRALEIYDHTLSHMAEIKNHSGARRREICALVGSSYALRNLGRNEEASRRLDSAFDRLRAVKDYPVEKIKPNTEVGMALFALADMEAARGHFAKAAEITEDLLARILAWGATPQTNLPDAVEVARAYDALASYCAGSGQRERGAEFAAKRLILWRDWDRRLPHNSFIQRQLNAPTTAPAIVHGM
jgi:serine/threonine-protein kinase